MRERAKRPFDLEAVLARVAAADESYPKAALFELKDRGFATTFEQVAACMISVRTLDEVTVPTALKLFAVARRPADVARLSVARLDRLLAPCTFHEVKARNLHAIAERCVDELGGDLPADEATLLSLPGIGPKCANLVLGVVAGVPRIAVDVHVHRIVNRWGYVATKAPEATRRALEDKVPRRLWIDLNRWLVPFGKHVCTGRAPRCSQCPVRAWCRQVGVTTFR